ncbi:hypothetical protein YC2023_110802 [Brassica napus]
MEEKRMFGFNGRDIDWEHYIVNVHLPGSKENSFAEDSVKKNTITYLFSIQHPNDLRGCESPKSSRISKDIGYYISSFFPCIARSSSYTRNEARNVYSIFYSIFYSKIE